MKILNYLLAAAVVLICPACEEETKTPSYPIMESVVDTLWWSTETTALGQTIFYDLEFGTSEGVLTAFDSAERDNMLSTKPFSYTFIDEVDGLSLQFNSGERYDGYLVQKGFLQVNGKDVYAIQLFEVDSEGNIILMPDGKTPEHSMLFWCE